MANAFYLTIILKNDYNIIAEVIAYTAKMNSYYLSSAENVKNHTVVG